MGVEPGVGADLRNALSRAMKDRDRIRVTAFRTALGAIGNAEAADVSAAPAAEAGTIAGGVAGLGKGEVPRRELSDAHLVELLRAEIADWEATAAEYQRHGRDERAQQLYAEAAALAELLNARAQA